MPRIRSRFVCQECGYEAPKWLGRCPGCGAWNTLVEEVYEPSHASSHPQESRDTPTPVISTEVEPEERFPVGIGELDRVLGGGIVPGSVILVAGDPGIGKSTLLLQLSDMVACAGLPVLYVSGEESKRQVTLRARRLGLKSPGLFVVSETDVDAIENHASRLHPGVVVVDSIQTMWTPSLESSPGSVAQVREAAWRFVRFAKSSGTAIFVVGHVTKSGMIAGPRVLEHMVDTVLYFEGERHHTFRILRAVKNRFGSTNEIGIFEMNESGLSEVRNPSAFFLLDRAVPVPGVAVTASMEGTRPILVEVQALVSGASFGTPRRVTIGVDYNRLAIILAVLEKRVGLLLSGEDVYVSVVGGLRLDDPASDLAVACSVASSTRGRPCNPGTVAIGEIGLSGEVRPVDRVEARVGEALRLGFKRCIVPSRNLKVVGALPLDVEVIGVETLGEALEHIEEGMTGAGRG
ncbi:MAG TPA: DNA repair protein RadA [Firmicutes bacterium]|nr:DNA repair protein RadA [Bacillota bacterium]